MQEKFIVTHFSPRREWSIFECMAALLHNHAHQSLLVDFANLVAIKMDDARLRLKDPISLNFAEDFYTQHSTLVRHTWYNACKIKYSPLYACRPVPFYDIMRFCI